MSFQGRDENPKPCECERGGIPCGARSMCFVCTKEGGKYFYFCYLHMPVDSAGLSWMDSLGPEALIGLL